MRMEGAAEVDSGAETRLWFPSGGAAEETAEPKEAGLGMVAEVLQGLSSPREASCAAESAPIGGRSG